MKIKIFQLKINSVRGYQNFSRKFVLKYYLGLAFIVHHFK